MQKKSKNTYKIPMHKIESLLNTNYRSYNMK